MAKIHTRPEIGHHNDCCGSVGKEFSLKKLASHGLCFGCGYDVHELASTIEICTNLST